MSTAAEVRTAWDANVWTDPLITAITTNIYDYDAKAVAQENEKFLEKLRFEKFFNFITYDIRRAQQFNVGKNQVEFTYPVEIQVVREVRVDSSFEDTAFVAAIDTFETIFGLVTGTLGSDWAGTVQGFNFQEGPPTITPDEIDGKFVWEVLYTYEGFKQTSF